MPFHPSPKLSYRNKSKHDVGEAVLGFGVGDWVGISDGTEEIEGTRVDVGDAVGTAVDVGDAVALESEQSQPEQSHPEDASSSKQL